MKYIIAIISLFILLGCQQLTNNDAVSIYNQLPDHGRLTLVPDDFHQHLPDSKIVIFTQIDSIQQIENINFSEEEFYKRVRKLGVQYIIVSSEMIEDGCESFPWITNKNFRVCPGNPNMNYDRYYTLLVWDNAKESFHFFKFLYPLNED